MRVTNWFILFCLLVLLRSYVRNHHLTRGHEDLYLCLYLFSSTGFTVSALMRKACTQQLTPVYDVRQWSTFFVLHAETQPLQYRLLLGYCFRTELSVPAVLSNTPPHCSTSTLISVPRGPGLWASFQTGQAGILQPLPSPRVFFFFFYSGSLAHHVKFRINLLISTKSQLGFW